MNSNSFYVRAIFAFFTFLWILIVVMNKLYESFAALILLLPFGYFFIGFMNADCVCEKEVMDDVLSVTFINTGLLLSLPIITFLSKDYVDKSINHVVYLTIVIILLSYPHIWASVKNRELYKVSRSCLETMSITLYIFVLTTFFMRT